MIVPLYTVNVPLFVMKFVVPAVVCTLDVMKLFIVFPFKLSVTLFPLATVNDKSVTFLFNVIVPPTLSAACNVLYFVLPIVATSVTNVVIYWELEIYVYSLLSPILNVTPLFI